MKFFLTLLFALSTLIPSIANSQNYSFEDAAEDNIHYVGDVVNPEGQRIAYIAVIGSSVQTETIKIKGKDVFIVEAFFLFVPGRTQQDPVPRVFVQSFACQFNKEVALDNKKQLTLKVINKGSISDMNSRFLCRTIKIT